FLDTWKRACETSGGVFTVSPGTYLLSGSVLFEGPCNGKTTVTINGVLKASTEVALPVEYWIRFLNVNDLTINGQGTLDGNGPASWGRGKDPPTVRPPKSLSLEKVSNVHIQDIKSLNSKMFHVKIYASQHVTLNQVTISAPADSTNTDGVHISRSSDIRIINSQIATGDDCISIGDGSSNVNISGVFCGPGHGISIGSLGKKQGEQDVSLITVTNCTLTGTTNGVRIKTFASPVSLTAHDLTFQHIIMNNVQNPIIINQHYCLEQKTCSKGESSVQIKGVKFIDVRGSSATQVGVKLDCSASKPCQDIQLSGVNLNSKVKPTIAACSNADSKFLEPNQEPSKCSEPAVTWQNKI
ncbi:polygalacturonase, partial [Phtheirospermum japonicum]